MRITVLGVLAIVAAVIVLVLVLHSAKPPKQGDQREQ